MRIFLHLSILLAALVASAIVNAESSSSSYLDFGDDHEDEFDSSYADKPQNVSAEPTSSTTIRIHWEPPFGESRHGSLMGYRIKFKSRGQKKSETIPVEANRHYFEVDGLERGTVYMFKMWAVFNNDSGPTTEWVTAETLQKDLDDSVVPDKPGQIRARTEAGAIHLSWSPPKNRSVFIQGYNIGWGVGFPDVFSRMVEGDRRTFTLDGDLQPNSEYVIAVKAFNRAGEGPPSYETVKTPALGEDGEFEQESSSSASSMMPPIGLKAQVLSSQSILLSWSDNQPARDGRLYLVKYTGTIHSPTPKYHYKNTTSQSVLIEDLKSNTEYEFAVQTVLNGRSQRSSTWSMSVSNTTEEALPGTSPRDLTIVSSPNGDATTVSVHWQPPKMPNGQVTGYAIFYTTDNTQLDRDWFVKNTYGDKLNTIINGLQSSQSYYFKIHARNQKGFGPLSNEVTFKTDAALPSTSQDPSISISLFLLGIILVSFVVLIAIGSAFNYFVNGRKKDAVKGSYIAAATSPKNGATRHPNNNNNGAAPPDLWIHHNDQVELKKMGRNGSVVGSASNGRDSPIMTRTATMENSFAKMKKTNSTYGMNASLYDECGKPMQSPIDNISTMRRASTLRKPSNHAIDFANGLEPSTLSRAGVIQQKTAFNFPNPGTVPRSHMSIDQIDSVSSMNVGGNFGAPSTLNFYDHVTGAHMSMNGGHMHAHHHHQPSHQPMMQNHGAEVHSASGGSSSGYMSGNNSSSSPHSVVSNNTVLTQSSTNTTLQQHPHHHPMPQSPPGNGIYMSNKRLQMGAQNGQLKSFGFPTPPPPLPSLASLGGVVGNGIASPNQIYNSALSNLSSPSKKFLLTTANGLSNAANLGGSSSTLASNGAKSTMNTYSDDHSLSGGINVDDFNHEMTNLDGMMHHRDSNSLMQNGGMQRV